MEFKRKKQRGLNQKTRKVWFSTCGQYRITWSGALDGVEIASHYYACFLSYTAPYSSGTYWTFCGKRDSYRTLKAAIEACEKHEKLWKYALQVSAGERKGRNDRLRAIDQKARIGKHAHANRVMAFLPVWVRPLANPVLMNLFFPRPGVVSEEDDECPASSTATEVSESPQSDPTNLSLTSEAESSTSPSSSSRKTRTSGRASNAKASEPSTTPTTRRAQSKGTKCETASSVQDAVAAGTSPKKSSRKPTAKSSTSTSKKKPSTKRSSKRGAAA